MQRTDLLAAGLAFPATLSLPACAGMLQDGQTRALAVTAKSRLKMLPNVPAYAEADLPQLNMPSWFGIGALASRPAPVLDILNRAVRQAQAHPDVAAAIEKQGAVPSPISRADLVELVTQEDVRWQKMVGNIGFVKM